MPKSEMRPADRELHFGCCDALGASPQFPPGHDVAEEAQRLGIPAKLESAWKMCHKVKTGEYLASLQGNLGLQPLGTRGQVFLRAFVLQPRATKG
jgi:hypothetical protein